MWDQFLESIGVKSYDELTPEERADFQKMQENFEKQDVTLEDVRNFIHVSRLIVDRKLATLDTFKDKNQDLYCRAQLMDLIMLEELLSGPERAKRAMQQYIATLGKKNA